MADIDPSPSHGACVNYAPLLDTKRLAYLTSLFTILFNREEVMSGLAAMSLKDFSPSLQDIFFLCFLLLEVVL